METGFRFAPSEKNKMLMSLSDLSQFYRNFAELDQAGITYIKAFEAFKRNQTDKDQIYKIQFMIEHLKKGRALSDGFRFAKYVPVFDIPLIKAAEDSGRLVEVFKMLAVKYSEAAESERSIRSQMFKPYFTLVTGLFVPSFPDYFTQKVTLAVYLKNSLGTLAIISGAAFAFYHLWMRSFYDLEKAKLLHSIQSFLPFFRGLSQKIAIEKFASSFGMMLDSGMDLFESLKQASLCSAESEISIAVNRMIPMIRAGVNMTQVFRDERFFPVELATAITLGAESGKLPEFLKRYSEGLKKEIDRKIQLLTKAIPMIMYWIVTLYVVLKIVKFYKGHLDDVSKVLEEN